MSHIERIDLIYGKPSPILRQAGPRGRPRTRVIEMHDATRDPWLLTPGPLTTSAAVKTAMLHDWGSRDARFIAVNGMVRERLLELAGASGTHACVPLQGS